MNAQAGPSRPRTSIPIDLNSISIDKSRITSSYSSTSIAPSLSTNRSSTQSTEGWGPLSTPRLERLSLAVSECSIIEDDVVIFGQGKDGEDRSIDSVMLEDARIGGLWVDLVSLLWPMAGTARLTRNRIRRPNLVIPNSEHQYSPHGSRPFLNNNRSRFRWHSALKRFTSRRSHD
jgi:hypothetical protein